MPPLWIPGILYEAAVRCRNRLYANGWLQTRALSAPVISVGNITLGGTGKTPLVIHIAHLLEQSGATPALLTRGYQRASRGMRIVAPDMPATAEDVGDEPALVRRRCPRIWLGVHHDRYRAGAAIARRCQNAVFLLDDGFQHRRLGRDLDILVIDSTRGLGNERVVPLGRLREPLASVHRAGALVITGGGTPDVDLARLCPGAPAFICIHEIRSIVPFGCWRGGTDTAALRTGPVFLVAGLGNPSRFFADVRKAGLEITGTRWLRDHGRLQPAGWRQCWEEAQSGGAVALVTTEKDAVKIRESLDVPLYVAVQNTRIVDQARFDRLLMQAAENRA